MFTPLNSKPFELPYEYIVRKFEEYAYNVSHSGDGAVYNGGCPICNEGSSFGRKKRCFYLRDKNVICCHNCGWYGSPMKWLMEVSGMNFLDIKREVEDGDYSILNMDFAERRKQEEESFEEINIFDGSLPLDVINLSDEQQISYYRGNSIVVKAVKYLKNRRLDTAVNRPNAFYLSLKDFSHKNRIIIPFYDEHGNIPFYQSRAYGGNTDGHNEDVRYLSKFRAERSLYGLDKVDCNICDVFLFEGPIDACFVRNGLAVAGITESQDSDLTPLQEEQLAYLQMMGHQPVWVLDSQWKDEASYVKTTNLLKAGHRVFIWPREIGTKYKDFNELCIAEKLDEVPYNFVSTNAHSGMSGLWFLKQNVTR